MRRRNFVRRGGRKPVNMQWSDVSGQFVFAAVAATSTSVLVQLQSPAALNSLTADPPEDLTVLRMVGQFGVSISAATASWSLALTVADVTWTPGATMSVDNDKRILWQQEYRTGAAAGNWLPPGMYTEGGAQLFPGWWEMTGLDISPKVKVEAGKALYLVAYENTGAATFTVTCNSMRLLYKRSGRR